MLRPPLQDEFDRLKESLPTTIAEALVSKIEAGERLVAPLEGRECTGCRHSIPLESYVELKTQKSLVLCRSCGALLYISERSAPEPGGSAPSSW